MREKESEEEKSVGKRKEKAKTGREIWKRESQEAKKAGKNENFLELWSHLLLTKRL